MDFPAKNNGRIGRIEKGITNSSLKNLLILAGLTLLICLGWIGWNAVKSYRVSSEMAERHLEIVRVRDGIVYLDEVLTMSARLAALTSDTIWESRYNYYVPKLDSMIKTAISLTEGEEGKRAVALTDSSNLALVVIELHAMELTRQGNSKEAVSLLFGARYMELKKVYAGGMEVFYRLLEKNISDTRARTRTNLTKHLMLVFAALFVLLLVWAAVARIINRWHKVLMEMNHTLSQKTEELTRFNEQLDERVKSATEDLKHSHSKLVQSEKMAALGILAAGVAHEINNPLSFLKSNMATLGEYMGSVKKALKAAQPHAAETEEMQFIVKDIDILISQSGEGVERVTEIVKGLRNFVQLDSPDKRDADINEGLEATLRLVSRGIARKYTINKNLAPLPRIPCHIGKLNQAFLNILMNASQAMETGGEISVDTRLIGEWITIGISDTGKGISQENLSKIFSPFFTTKPVGQGLGLGLSISYGIVQDHGGRIDVESVPNKRTTFTIYLPVSRTPTMEDVEYPEIVT